MSRMKIRALLVLLLAAASQQSPPPIDCSDIYRGGAGKDGVYTIYPAGPTSPVQVYCDMSQDDNTEKWTIIQRRQDGSLNFFRKWDQYKNGFGSATGEYWLGLETMHLLSLAKRYELWVDLEDFEGQRVFAQYASFSVASETDGYRLDLGKFVQGAAGDSLSTHNGQKFTTLDRDQDTHGSNCARLYYGAFWYAACHSANLNGFYAWGPSTRATGINWSGFRGIEYSQKYVAMKIRPISTAVARE